MAVLIVLGKSCVTCKERKPLEAFSRCKPNKDGLQYTCKACQRLIGLEYRQRPGIKERAKAYKQSPQYQQWQEEYKKNSSVYLRFKTMEEKLRQSHEAYNLKVQAMNIIGGCRCSNPDCLVTGGCKDLRALQIDHIQGCGVKNRLHVKQVYRLIVANPEEARNKYQVLCANCNAIKRYLKGEGVKFSPLMQTVVKGDGV